MVGSIKNRIAAFEDLALKSKSSSQLMSILPPEHGFAASKNRSAIFGAGIKGKETSGYVPPPVKTERKKPIPEKRDVGRDESSSSSRPSYASSLSTKQQMSPNLEGEKLHEELKGKEKLENTSGGPISVISVASRDNKESSDDSHSVSPLSFQGEKMLSGGSRSVIPFEENILDVINETASDNTSEGDNLTHESRDEVSDDQKEAGSFDGASFDGKDENSLNEDMFSDASNEGDKDVKDEDFLPDINSAGPSIDDQEEYDNFTLGSGESEAASDERSPKSSNDKRNDATDLEYAQNEDVIGNYKSDDGSEEKSFSDYISNMRPIPSFNEMEERQDSEEPYQKGNDYISGDEEDDELDDLSEKVDDDVLNTGGRTVQEILDDTLEEYREIKDSTLEGGDYGMNESVLHRGNYVEDKYMSNGPSVRINHSHSPIYYPEEDFKEDDEDFDNFDNETADDETGDLLGVNFEELSLISDEKGINSYRPTPAKGTAREDSITNSNRRNALNSRDISHGKNNMHYHQEIDSSRNLYGIEKQKYPLALIREEQSTVIDHVSNSNFVEGTTSPYQGTSNRFPRESNNVNDELSQITESTYDGTHKATKWRMNHPQDQRTHTSQSDQSYMMYSFNDSANSSSIMPRTVKNGPIFRDRNSLSKNMKLNSTSSISEITDPLSAGNRRKSMEYRRTETKVTDEHNKLLTINSANSMSSDLNRLSINQKQSSASPNTAHVRKKSAARRSEENNQRGRQQKHERSRSRSFSLRSLSPFRRLNSRNNVDKTLLKAQNDFRRDQARARAEDRNMKLNRSFSTSGSTPGEILKEEEDREVSVPLVALSPSYDGLERKVTKKKFSLRSLSPFRRLKIKKKSKSRIIDPFDEGNGSF